MFAHNVCLLCFNARAHTITVHQVKKETQVFIQKLSIVKELKQMLNVTEFIYKQTTVSLPSI